MEEKQNTIPSQRENSISRSLIRSKTFKRIKKPTYHEQASTQFIHYISELDNKISYVNQEQLRILKNKYRFYLGKIQKLQTNKENLEQRLNNFNEIINNSQSIIDCEKNIKFIQMILGETNQKLENLSQKLNAAKSKKKIFQIDIIRLKSIIKKEKDEFFRLKREQLLINKQLKDIEKKYQLGIAENRFKSILASKVQTIRNQSRSPTLKLPFGTQSPFKVKNSEIHHSSNKGHHKNISAQFPQMDKEIIQTAENIKLFTEKKIKDTKVSIHVEDKQNLGSSTIPACFNAIKIHQQRPRFNLRDSQKSSEKFSASLTPKIKNQSQAKIITKISYKESSKHKTMLGIELRKFEELKRQLEQIIEDKKDLARQKQRKTFSNSNQAPHVWKRTNQNDVKFWKEDKKLGNSWTNLGKYSIKKQIVLMNKSKKIFRQDSNRKTMLPKITKVEDCKLSKKDQSDTNLLAAHRNIEKFNIQNEELQVFMKLSVSELIQKIASTKNVDDIFLFLEKESLSPGTSNQVLQS